MDTPVPDGPRIARVAMICDYALDYLGGAQTALTQQVVALRRSGVQVTVVAPAGRRRAAPLAGPDPWLVSIASRWTVPWVRLPVVRNTPALQRLLRDTFRARGVQAVHLHSEFGIAAAAIAAARHLRLPVVHTVHTFFWQTDLPIQPVLARVAPRWHRGLTGLHSPAVRLAERPGDSALRNMTLAVAEVADVVVSPSRHQAERLRDAGLEQVAEVPNALGAVPRAEPLSGVDGCLRLLWVGRCVPEKRILPFVEAAAEAIDRVGPGRLQVSIVGDGSQLPAARRIAAGRGDIIFHGRLAHSRVLDLLRHTHATVLTSYGFDNQPMTVVESIMALRGVVYRDPALTEGLQGPGIEAFDPSQGALADVLVGLVHDPGRVVGASRAAAGVKREFAPETLVERLQQVYRHAEAVVAGRDADAVRVPPGRQ